MAVLPIVDLMILFSWTTLAAGALLKTTNVIFSKNWDLLGFAPLDLLMISVSMLIFAIALIGRQWLKANENVISATRRANATLDAYDEVRGDETRRERTAHQASVQPAWETRPLER